MGLIPEAAIEQVLARADILPTAQNYVTLKKSGQNYKGLCPFHNENTPSFYVHPGKGIYKCFGCGKGGNVISFLMEIEGWSFPETVRHLAERNGVEIPEESDEDAERRRKRRKGKKLYHAIMQSAREFYETALWSDQGAAARHYLAERGVDEDTARAFGLGYAPQGWQNLLDHLQQDGYAGKLAERAGLALARNKNSGHYDRFRHRIVFPVVDIWGHTLAFGGRRLAEDEDTPKYINSPETQFYTKGDQLYGLEVAKQSIQKSGTALLVEGNFDVIVLHATGIETAVAPMGTALTEGQARLLNRYADRVVVAFDGDEAGEKASVRCIPALQKTNLDARVIRFDELEDPDTFVRRHGADALRQKVEEAQPLVGWALDRVLAPVEGASVERKLTALEDAGDVLRQVENKVTWEHYAQEVSRRLSIEPHLLEDYVRRPERARDKARQAVRQAQQGLELESAEYGMLVVLMERPGWITDFLEEQLDNLLSSREFSNFLQKAHDHFEERGELRNDVLLEQVDSQAFRRTVDRAMLDEETAPDDPDKRVRFYKDCVRTLKRKWAQRTKRELTRKLDELDFHKQREAYEELVEQRKEIEHFENKLDRQTRRQ